jgi:hypothetical protein
MQVLLTKREAIGIKIGNMRAATIHALPFPSENWVIASYIMLTKKWVPFLPL